MRKKMFALVLALFLCISTGLPALAVQTGSISITMKYENEAVPGGTMTLYHVGTAQGSRYVLTDAFAESKVDLSDLASPETAAALAAYVRGHHLAGTTENINEEGKVIFSGLRRGLYLLVQEKAAEGYSPVNPFLVTIPLDGTYEVDATPKMDPLKPDKPDEPGTKTGGLIVYKEVTGQGDKNKNFTFTVTLSDATINGWYGEMWFVNGVATFTLKHGESKRAAGLPAGIGYTVTESGNEGYTVSSSNSTGSIPKDAEAWVVFRNDKDGSDDPDPGYTSRTVKKVWKLDNGGTAARSVTVALLRNGERYDTVTLSAANGWTYTWDNLDSSYIWTVMEVDVPDGFTAAIDWDGETFIITNDDKPEDPGVPNEPDNPDTPRDPDDPDIPDEPNIPDVPDTPDEPDAPGEPRTGDETLTPLWAGLCLLALGGMAILGLQGRHREKAQNDE